MQFDEFFLYYKDIRRKAFFTMTTLLMPLLENGYFYLTLKIRIRNLKYYCCDLKTVTEEIGACDVK